MSCAQAGHCCGCQRGNDGSGGSNNIQPAPTTMTLSGIMAIAELMKMKMEMEKRDTWRSGKLCSHKREQQRQGWPRVIVAGYEMPRSGGDSLCGGTERD